MIPMFIQKIYIYFLNYVALKSFHTLAKCHFLCTVKSQTNLEPHLIQIAHLPAV